MSDEATKPKRGALKLLAWLVLLAALLGGGWYAADYFGLFREPEPDLEAVAPPASRGTPAPAPTGEPSREPSTPAGAELAEVGCVMTIATGWQRGDATPAMGIYPVESNPEEASVDVPRTAPPVVLEKPGDGELPLFLLGRLPAQTVGEREPEAFVAGLMTSLRESLAALPQPPEFTADGPLDPLPELFIAARELVAEGSFADMGVSEGVGRFVAGVDRRGQVYLAIAFAPAGETDAEAVAMIGSLAPVPEPVAEAEPEPGEQAPDAEVELE